MLKLKLNSYVYKFSPVGNKTSKEATKSHPHCSFNKKIVIKAE